MSERPEWKEEIAKRLASLKLDPGREAEIVDELSQHLEEHYQELLAGGASESDARRMVLHELGETESPGREQTLAVATLGTRENPLARGLQQAEREAKPHSVAWGGGLRKNLVADLWQDLRYGLRQLRRNPGFTTVAVITLALGIGANTAIFSVVNAVLLRPLPYRDPSRLVMVYHVPPAKSFPGMTEFDVSPANYLDWRRQNHVFDPIAIYRWRGLDLTATTHPETVNAAKVSADFLKVLGVEPKIGRVFAPEEEQPGHANEVILGNAFWHTHFGANPNIVGRTIKFDEQAYTVIGVMPANFRYPSWAQVWVPLGWTAEDRAIRSEHNYWVMARLKRGVSLRQAQAEMNTISSRLAQQYPSDDAGWGALVVPLHEDLVGGVRPALLILLGAVAFVLLIACSNVASLVLEKVMSRRKEIALRTALGATRSRVLRQILSETSILALAGGALGFFLARLTLALISTFLAHKLPRTAEIRLDGWVLAFTLAISLVTGIVAGLAPAWHMTKLNINGALKEGFGRTSSDSGAMRTRNVLVVSEMALSLVLLAGATLLIRTLWTLRNSNPGFDPHNVLTFKLVVSPTEYPHPAQRIRFFDRVLRRVRAVPGVEDAGAIDDLPLGGNGGNWPIAIEGRPARAVAEQPEVDTVMISPGYFRTLHIPLLRGRFFNESDRPGTQPVIVISQAMANRFWPHENPIGKRLTTAFDPGASLEVVGVVANVKSHTLADLAPRATMYIAILQLSDDVASLVVRTPVTPANMIPAITEAVHQVDRDQPMADIMPMDQVLNNSLSKARFNMTLLVSFAGLALALAAIGIYGVIAYSVAQRTHEMGIRMALGAQKQDILRLVVGQGLVLALIGIGAGIVAALGVTRLMASLLFGVKPTDPLTFLLVSLLLTAVALVASYIPARRAAEVDPMRALRCE
jgi:putative ABC transport system permease protein